jgi:hypothetical protein
VVINLQKTGVQIKPTLLKLAPDVQILEKECPPVSVGSCVKRLARAQDVPWIGRPAG